MDTISVASLTSCSFRLRLWFPDGVLLVGCRATAPLRRSNTSEGHYRFLNRSTAVLVRLQNEMSASVSLSREKPNSSKLTAAVMGASAPHLTLFTVCLLLLLYGYEIFNFSLSIDEEAYSTDNVLQASIEAGMVAVNFDLRSSSGYASLLPQWTAILWRTVEKGGVVSDDSPPSYRPYFYHDRLPIHLLENLSVGFLATAPVLTSKSTHHRLQCWF